MMSIRDNSTPVVVLKSVRHGALGITRSLGRLGIPVYNIHSDHGAPAFWSRYNRGKFLWDVENAPAEASLDYLQEVARAIGRRSILIPTADSVASFVAEHAQVLKEWLLFPSQPPRLVQSLCSKKGMYYLAKQHRIPTAETTFPGSRRDVLEFLTNATFPIMLKGIDGKRLQNRAGKRMFIVHTERELLDCYERMEDPDQPNLMLQEYIPGDEDVNWMFNGYFNGKSDCLLGFVGKKLRQFPIYTGQTSLGMCVSNETVEATTKTFMKVLGYRGVLDIDYRYDARDDLYKVLDVNPRIGATFRLFVDGNGIDVARALYCDLTGQTITPAPARDGRKWMVEDDDLASCLGYYRDGKLTITEWLKSLRGIDEAGLCAADDLLPILATCRLDAREISRRIYAKTHQLRCHDKISAKVSSSLGSILLSSEFIESWSSWLS